MYLKVVSGMPSELTEQVILVSHITKLKYPSRVGPMTRAIAAVVTSVLMIVISTSNTMKMKLRPTTLVLLRTGGESWAFRALDLPGLDLALWSAYLFRCARELWISRVSFASSSFGLSSIE